jgi:hypothetical protein
MLRYLRIAVTALSLTACVLLIVLWVRSYWQFEQIIHRTSATDFVAVTATRGQIAVGGSNDPTLSIVFKRNWMHRGFPLKGPARPSAFPVFPVSTINSSFVVGSRASLSYELMFPYWVLALTLIVLGAIPWLTWRFSLTTLLVTTAMVAVGLGVLVGAH